MPGSSGYAGGVGQSNGGAAPPPPQIANPNAGQQSFSYQYNPAANNDFTNPAPKSQQQEAANAQQAALRPTNMGMMTPNLFSPYAKYMPDQFNQNKPINNPNPILDSYMQHMPDFLQGAKPMYVYKNPDQIANPAYKAGIFNL